MFVWLLFDDMGRKKVGEAEFLSFYREGNLGAIVWTLFNGKEFNLWILLNF